jgi:hypothetical protein
LKNNYTIWDDVRYESLDEVVILSCLYHLGQTVRSQIE